MEHGVALFNEGSYFQAHEVWEDWWRVSKPEESRTIQGLIQVAVAMHHLSKENREGARSVMMRALRNLEPVSEFYGVDVTSLRDDMQKAISQLEQGGAVKAFSIHQSNSGSSYF